MVCSSGRTGEALKGERILNPVRPGHARPGAFGRGERERDGSVTAGAGMGAAGVLGEFLADGATCWVP